MKTPISGECLIQSRVRFGMDKAYRAVDEYMIDLNKSAAAKRAGCTSVIFEREDVQAEIERRQYLMSHNLKITAEMVVERLWFEGTPPDEDEAPCDTKQASRVAATVAVGKHLGMFTERVEMTHGLSSAMAAKAIEAGMDPKEAADLMQGMLKGYPEQDG